MACYSIAYNADMGGHATRVLLSPDDRWVGHDYWTYTGEITITPMDRALRVMRHYERRNQTNHPNYRRAQRIALSLLLPKFKETSE